MILFKKLLIFQYLNERFVDVSITNHVIFINLVPNCKDWCLCIVAWCLCIFKKLFIKLFAKIRFPFSTTSEQARLWNVCIINIRPPLFNALFSIVRAHFQLQTNKMQISNYYFKVLK